MRERKHFRMRSDMVQGTVDYLGCTVNYVLSCHSFRFLFIFVRSLLGYLKDCNVAAHSVDSDIYMFLI